MKKVLAISPRFPPTNAPDHQRLRMALPHFKAAGWDVTVLSVEPGEIEAGQDPLLCRSLPKDLEIHRVNPVPTRWTRCFGFGGLAYRSWFAIDRAACRYLKGGDYDLVLFTTTEFPLMALGPKLLKKFGVPYVIDLQDPWVTDHYAKNPDQRKPGGSFKHGASQWLARRLESMVMRNADKIFTVSPAYPEMLKERYPGIDDERFSVIPFCASESDIAIARSTDVQQTVFDPEDGMTHWVYTGRAGPDMRRSLSYLFRAVKQGIEKGTLDSETLRFHFVGTDYAMKAEAGRWVSPIAKEYGIEHLVTEIPERLPYYTALKCLCDADALIVPGSDDSGYTASKLYPYILAKKPLLAIFHEESSVVRVLQETGGGTAVTFGTNDSEDKAISITSEIEKSLKTPISPMTEWDRFDRYMAPRMVNQIVSFVG